MPPGKKGLKAEEPDTSEAPEKDASDVVKPLPKEKVEPVPMAQVTPYVEIPQGDSESDKIKAKLVTILKEHNMCESEVPLNSEYWQLRTKLQGMS